jgi:D-alanyl-D-alanine carboxypeptidase
VATTIAVTPRPTVAVTAIPRPTPVGYALGSFPDFPVAALGGEIAVALQAKLDQAVAAGGLTAVTAAVIVVGHGSWSGAAGSADGAVLTTESLRRTHSSAKTIVAAEILHLAENGILGLDDLASSHLPPTLAFFDANGATIRQVLGMRSGIPGLNESAPEGGYYPAEQASTAVEVFKRLPEPIASPGGPPEYASTNYVLLGLIIEHVTGKPLATALRADVLSNPALAGIRYTVDDALASDGWGVVTTTGALARWGYELYGGFVLSPASLEAMLDFQGSWYGLGAMDLFASYGTLAVGHEGESSVGTCCSIIRLVALPAQGLVIAVQANTPPDPRPYDRYNGELVGLTRGLREIALGLTP